MQPWPKGLPGFDESREAAYPYDPAKAKTLLAEAGYPDGFTISGDFLASTGANIDKAAEAVQANLADIGIKIKLRRPVWSPAGASPELLGLIKGTDDPTLSEDDRAAKVGKAIDHATDNALFAPLWQGIGGLAASSKVEGLNDIASLNGGVADLRNTWMTE